MNTVEKWHGTISGYNSRGCRCDSCRSAASAYKKSYRKGSGAALVAKAYRQRQRAETREVENIRRKELKLRKKWNEAPVETMPYYRFLAEQGQTF